MPAGACSIVLFAHGSGSSRHCSRNQYVAHALRTGGVGTLLFDLLTPQEVLLDAPTRHLSFDITLLARRLLHATQWLARRPEIRDLSLGYFGASTGGAAALVAAALGESEIGAVVSRGGRPDLAGATLSRIRAPTLLIVGATDSEGLAFNRDAYAHLQCPKELEVVPGASLLFEEAGALERVARSAGAWFQNHLARGADAA